VPLASSTSTTSTLSWDDTNYTTVVAVTNPRVVAATDSIIVWNSAGAVIGTSSIALPAGAKTAANFAQYARIIWRGRQIGGLLNLRSVPEVWRF
jgi:hypothetical protein